MRKPRRLVQQFSSQFAGARRAPVPQRRPSGLIRRAAMAGVLCMCFSAPPALRAQPAPMPFHSEPYALHSGKHAGQGTETLTAYENVVASPGAQWLRLHFGDHNLGQNSFITITSLFDGGQQRLDAESMVPWQNSSAIFNGDTVTIQLHVAPGEQGIFFELETISVGEQVQGVEESQCGATDDRFQTSDFRVGRISPIGCTGWVISNGAHLTAGHCAPGLTTQILEFDVPDSTCNGTTVAADPNDQYPITSENFFDDGAGAIGNDWAVFAVGPNANTGLLPVQAYGVFFRTSRDDNPVDVRVTGYGVDFVPVGCGPGNLNSDSQTEQTHVGNYLGETIQGASDVFIEYTVDTEGGNSGSPVIVRVGGITQNYTLGIHTNAGCNPPSTGNTGTGFEHNNLETAISTAPPGVNEEYVDDGHPHAAALGDGTVHRPFDTVPEAVSAVVSGGTIVIVAGSYTNLEGNTFLAGSDTKAMTLLAPVGTVTIGN